MAVEMAERQYDLHRQRKQRQAGAQTDIRSEPEHGYAFTPYLWATIAQPVEPQWLILSPGFLEGMVDASVMPLWYQGFY